MPGKKALGPESKYINYQNVILIFEPIRQTTVVLQPPPFQKISSKNWPKRVHTQQNATTSNIQWRTTKREARGCANTSYHHPP